MDEESTAIRNIIAEEFRTKVLLNQRVPIEHQTNCLISVL